MLDIIGFSCVAVSLCGTLLGDLEVARFDDLLLRSRFTGIKVSAEIKGFFADPVILGVLSTKR